MSYFSQTGLRFPDYLQSGSPEAVEALQVIATQLGVGQQVVGEVPAGAIDGSNVIFYAQFPFVPESLEVFLNGLRQRIIWDYQSIGTNQIDLSVAPQSGESILINYVKA